MKRATTSSARCSAVSSRRLGYGFALLAAVAIHTSAGAQVVFQAASDNGYFVPFNNLNASTVIYGDGGWFGSGGDAPATLGKITLGLAAYNSLFPGTTDIVFSLTDGDPSGLVFGSGAPLYTTVLHNVELPSTEEFGVQYFSLEIPLPHVHTLGGFNNIGWSIALQNYDYAGEFGFQVSSCAGQFVGFYTVNASWFDGAFWNLFSFGGGCSGVANYVATIELAPPCPADLDGSGTVDGADLAILLGGWGGSVSI